MSKAGEYVYGTDGHEGHWLTGEEIVRCKDCKHFKNDSRYGAWCGYFDSSLHDDYDGFCAWGERRDA